MISKIGITIFGGPRQILKKRVKKLLNISDIIPIKYIYLETRVESIGKIGITIEIFKSFWVVFSRI